MSESGAGRGQLWLELLVFGLLAALLLVAAARIPSSRTDAGFVLALGVALHAVGFVRFVLRAADDAEHDPAS